MEDMATFGASNPPPRTPQSVFHPTPAAHNYEASRSPRSGASSPPPNWWPSGATSARKPRSTSAPPARPSPTVPVAFAHEPSSRYMQGEREREAARLEGERRSHARLVEAEQRAAAAMQELARVHAELNASSSYGWDQHGGVVPVQ